MVQSITYNVKNSIEELKLKEIATNTATPVISISNNTLSISCSTVNATIYYTTDGSTPDINSSVYTSSVSLSPNVTTVKAVAIKSGNSSAVVTESFSYEYNVDAPVISQEWGNITMTSSTPGATIYYTTDGSTPDINSSEYTYTFYNTNQTVKAVAVKDGEYSQVTTYIYVKPPRPRLTSLEVNIDNENATATITADISEYEDGIIRWRIKPIDSGEEIEGEGYPPIVLDLTEACEIEAYGYLQWYGIWDWTDKITETYYP